MSTNTLGAITPGEEPLAIGNAIIGPDGRLEMDYFHTQKWRNKYDEANPLTGDEWVKRHRGDDHKLVRVAVYAHSTANRTGKLPSQLLAENDELVGALREMCDDMQHHNFGMRSPEQWETESYKAARAILSKYPKP